MNRFQKVGAFLLMVTVAAILPLSRPAFASFTNSNLVGPYTFQANGFFTDDDGEWGNLTLNGVLVFSGTGTFTTTTSGLTVTGLTTGLTGSNQTTGQGGDQFSCSPTLASGAYSMSSDGVFTLTFNFTATNSCLGNFDDTTNTQIVFRGTFIPGNIGATSNVASTTFTPPVLNPTDDASETGITFPEQGATPDSGTETEIITGLGMNGTISRQ